MKYKIVKKGKVFKVYSKVHFWSMWEPVHGNSIPDIVGLGFNFKSLEAACRAIQEDKDLRKQQAAPEIVVAYF